MYSGPGDTGRKLVTGAGGAWCAVWVSETNLILIPYEAKSCHATCCCEPVEVSQTE